MVQQNHKHKLKLVGITHLKWVGVQQAMGIDHIIYHQHKKKSYHVKNSNLS